MPGEKPQAAPFDYVLKSSASKIHLSLGFIAPIRISFGNNQEVSRTALSGGFGFEVPVSTRLWLAIDADLHDLAAFELHTRFFAVSSGFKYSFHTDDRRMIIKPLATLGIGYVADRAMPFREKTIYILRTGVDLNISTDSRLQWLLSGSLLFFPAIQPGSPDVHFTPTALIRFGIII